MRRRWVLLLAVLSLAGCAPQWNRIYYNGAEVREIPAGRQAVFEEAKARLVAEGQSPDCFDMSYPVTADTFDIAFTLSLNTTPDSDGTVVLRHTKTEKCRHPVTYVFDIDDGKFLRRRFGR